MPKPRTQEKKTGGFRLGPKLGKGVYQGHTAKIKATLIHKAKLKKSYHKDLADAGYGDEGTGSNGGALGVRKGKVVKPVLGDQRRGPQDDDDDEDEEMNGGEDEEDEGKGRASRAQQMRSDSDSDSEDEDVGKKGKGAAKGRPGAAVSRSQPPSRNDTAPAPSKRPRPTPATTPIAAEPAKKPRLSEEEVEKLRSQKRNERKEWGQRGRGGQPKLGGRVDMLLARIKRGMES